MEQLQRLSLFLNGGSGPISWLLAEILKHLKVDV